MVNHGLGKRVEAGKVQTNRRLGEVVSLIKKRGYCRLGKSVYG
jgi:hypothetical protein